MDVVSYLLGKNASGGGGGTTNKIYPYNISFRENTDEVIDLSNVDFSKMGVNNLNDMFNGCYNVKELHFNNLTLEVQSIQRMFKNCTNLETANFDTINLGDIGAASNMSDAFTGCSKLTDDSLDRILVMCLSSPVSSSLWSIGVRYYATSRIQALPHYQDFVAAGWSIGY